MICIYMIYPKRNQWALIVAYRYYLLSYVYAGDLPLFRTWVMCLWLSAIGCLLNEPRTRRLESLFNFDGYYCNYFMLI